MSLTAVIILNAILDFAVVAALILVNQIPFRFGRRSADLVARQVKAPLALAA